MAIPVGRDQLIAPAFARARPQPAAIGRARQVALSRAFSANGAAAMAAPTGSTRIPYERENAIRFLNIDQISAIRADGHYTMVMRNGAEFFCPWSISRVEQVIQSPPFMRTHRSYLVNLKHVTGFKREGDKAFCLVSEDARHAHPGQPFPRGGRGARARARLTSRRISCCLPHFVQNPVFLGSSPSPRAALRDPHPQTPAPRGEGRTSMIPGSFDYHRPKKISEAVGAAAAVLATRRGSSPAATA